MVMGLLFGPAGFGLLTDVQDTWFPIVADMALVMIGFLLGERLTRRKLKELGRPALVVSLAVVGVTAVTVAGGLALFGASLATCLLLASIATATAPAATVDVVKESGATGPFSETLLAIVALDDVWGLMLFSLFLSLLGTPTGAEAGFNILAEVAWEIGGAIGLGAVLGLPMAYLTGRIEPGEPVLAEALGVVFLCGGIAIWLDVSFLLAAITLGAFVANLAKHHTRPFHAIEGIDAPFLILFFVLAGASLELEALLSMGFLGSLFVVLRAVSRPLGGLLGGALGGLPASQRSWIGIAMLPQAGVALGMALLAVKRFPELTDTILPVVIASTVVFELLGPIATRVALRHVGEEKLLQE